MKIVLGATRNMYAQLQVLFLRLKQTQPRLEHVYALVEDDLPPVDMLTYINVRNYPAIINNKVNYNNRWTYMTFARCYLPDMLPNEDKVLWLDLDLFIHQDISELWDIDLTNYAIGGVIEANMRDNTLPYIDNFNSYINAGVLLMNLKYLREHNITERMDYLLNHYPLAFPDQDVFNLTCQGHIKYLSHKWNSGKNCGYHDEPLIEHWSAIKPWDPRSKRFPIWAAIYLTAGAKYSIEQ